MKVLKIAGVVVLVVVLAIVVYAKMEGIVPVSWVDKQQIHTTDGVAIDGYDPVNYFTNRSARKGTETYQTQWRGATWYFVSEANKIAFENDPESFSPQFGGYCSFAVSKGFTANCDPSMFLVEGDKLYLFHAEDVKQEAILEGQSFVENSASNWTE